MVKAYEEYRTVNQDKVPTEVKEYLAFLNQNGYLPTNDCTYYPKGDNPNKENNPARVYHQLENGTIVITDSYTF